MPIVVVGGVKGGSGKSTIATNLVVLRSTAGKKVLLVDADDQRSASDWAEHRESLGIETPWTTISLLGASVRAQLIKLSKDYDDIICDVGGRDTISQRAALSVADIFLTPFQPKSYDVWTVGKVCSLITEVRTVNPKLIAYAVLNRSDSQGNDNDGAEGIIQKNGEGISYLPFRIGQRKAFSNAASEGLGVIELKAQDKKASSEIKQLCDAVFSGRFAICDITNTSDTKKPK